MVRRKNGRWKKALASGEEISGFNYTWRCFKCYSRKRHRARRLARGGQRVSARPGVRNLSDWYVRLKLSQNTAVPRRYWSREEVELKRAFLTARRTLLSL